MRLHPISLPYRGLSRAASLASSLFFLGLVAGSATPFATAALLPALFALGGVVGLGWEFAYYRRFDYELTADTLDIRSGVVSRRNREIPLRRVQNVDISRNVVQRTLGIAAVNFETAGGGQTEASLRYVGYDEAKRLQREIQRRKRTADGETDTEAEDVELVYEMTPGELAVLSVVSFDLRLLSALLVVVPMLPPYVPDAVLGALGVVGILLVAVGFAALLWFAGAVVTIARYYGFRLTRVGDELRYERGLFQRYDGSIPLDKVQTLTLRENVLKRRFGYATLAVETAGYSAGQAPAGGSEAAVPLTRRDRALSLARSVEPFGDVAFERPPKRARRRYAGRYALALGGLAAVLFGVDAVTGWVGRWYLPLAALPLAPVAAHYKWLHRGYRVGEAYALTRNGFWRRATSVVPHYRVQTVVQEQSIFQRRWGLATVVVDTASSALLSGGPRAADVDVGTADALREEIHRKLQTALRHRAAERRRERDRERTVDRERATGESDREAGESKQETGENDAAVARDEGDADDPPNSADASTGRTPESEHPADEPDDPRRD